MTDNNKVETTIQVNQKDLRTEYANIVFPNVTPEEVVLDFGLNTPALQKQNNSTQLVCNLHSRIVLTPQTAKRLAITLSQVIKNYEKQFGEIKINNQTKAENPEK